MSRSIPPRLIVKTLAVTFVTVFALLASVFAFATLRVRDQIRSSVINNLASTQRLFAALEERRHAEWHARAANLAGSPALKAAFETYATEHGGGDETRRRLLVNLQNELDKVTTVAESAADAIVLVDQHQRTLASSGGRADEWPAGRPIVITPASGAARTLDGATRIGDRTFHIAAAPLRLGDATPAGTLYVATSLDRAYANEMKRLSQSDVAIVNKGSWRRARSGQKRHATSRPTSRRRVGPS